MTSHHASLPTKPHPIASAFFDQHDNELEIAQGGEFPIRAGTVAYARNSLGWRTRYSSSALYPVSILPVEGRRPRQTSEGNNSEPESFHVRQIFPGGNREKIHDGNDKSQRLHDDALCEDDCELGTGATVWPGSIVLLKYLEKVAHDPRQCNILEGKTVADLGSGTAITSIASALLGASTVVCTDGCDPVVDLACENIHNAVSFMDRGAKTSLTSGENMEEINLRRCDFRGCNIIAQKYCWGEGMSEEEIALDIINGDQNLKHGSRHDVINERMQSRAMHFDVILGADCIVPKLYPIEPLVDAIDELSSDETISYLSYEHRHYEHFDPAEEFRRLADLRNLDVEVVSDHEMHPKYPANDIQIWKVTRSDKYCGAKWPMRGTQKVCTSGGNIRSNHKSLLVENHL